MAQIGGVALNTIEEWEFFDSNDSKENIINQFSEEVENGYGISHYRQLKKIYQNFRNGQIEKIPFLAKDCIHTLRLIHAIYASIEKGRKVYLSEHLSSSKLGIENDTE